VQAEHRPVRARGAAASRALVGRSVRRSLVARAPQGETSDHGRIRSLPPGRSILSAERKANMSAPEVRKLKLWHDRVETEIEVSGHGPPLVYLHGPWGLAPDRPFVAQLAGRNTVYAPKFPGTSPGNHAAVHTLDSWLDLVVYHGELFERL